MKDKLVLILMLLLLLILIISMIYGLPIREFEILSISQLKNKNEELNQKINKASNLTTIDYPDNIEILEETYDKYKIKKQKYEEMSDFVDTNNKSIYENKQYDIGYLWRIFGKGATSRNLTLGMDVEKVGIKNLYNLNFIVSGQYVNISQFITDLENNSDLYFRIYNFKMTGTGEIISATFSVKNVNIDPSTLNRASI